MKKPHTIRVDKDLLEQVRTRAEQERITLSHYVEEALETLLYGEDDNASENQPDTKSDDA